MAPQYTCTSCSGRFGPTIFADITNPVCRFCKTREKTLEDLQKALQKIDALTAKVEALSEFVSLNVGTHTPPPLATDNNTDNATVPPQDDFQTVKNNVKPKKRILPTTKCYNPFSPLSDTADEEEVRLIGDSLVRSQLNEFLARAPATRKRFCIPGGRVQDVIEKVKEVTDQAPATTTYVIHVGTNDIQDPKSKSEELLDKYRQMIKAYKEKSSKVILSGIIPRTQAGQRFYSFASSINRRLANLCSEENIGFVNTWDHFYYDDSLFSIDGLHLSQIGAARFGRLLDGAVRDFRSKNGNVLAHQASAD